MNPCTVLKYALEIKTRQTVLEQAECVVVGLPPDSIKEFAELAFPTVDGSFNRKYDLYDL